MKPLVVIPARGGSKGVPRKNIKLFDGKPLILHTIDEALKLFPKDLVCVSTDDLEIKEIVETAGLPVPFLRPETLATDQSGTYEVLLHALQHYKEEKGIECDTVILLQPTSPFRTASHIQQALDIYSDTIDMVVSVKETHANPYYLLFEEDEDGFLKKSKEGNFTRRQDCPAVWEYNGAVYVINAKSLQTQPLNQFKKVVKMEMDERSSFDIDTPLDWKIAELLKNQG